MRQTRLRNRTIIWLLAPSGDGFERRAPLSGMRNARPVRLPCSRTSLLLVITLALVASGCGVAIDEEGTAQAPAEAFGTTRQALAPNTTFTVVSTADNDDARPGDGRCADTRGYCTLRAAIQEANALGSPPSGFHEILLMSSLYRLKDTGRSSTQLNLTSNVWLRPFDPKVMPDVRAAPSCTTSPACVGRVIRVDRRATVRIEGARISGGRLRSADNFFAPESSFGAGLLNFGSLELFRTEVSDNTTVGGAGGGIANLSGSLTVFESAFDGNQSSSDLGALGSAQLGGGAIYSMGATKIDQCSFRYNQAQRGGAVFAYDFGTETRNGQGQEVKRATHINGSSFLENSASLTGAAIQGKSAFVELVNSTVSGNTLGPEGTGSSVDFEASRDVYDVAYTANPARGAQKFAARCTTCHGATRLDPDKYSSSALTAKIFLTMFPQTMPLAPGAVDPCAPSDDARCAQDVAAYLKSSGWSDGVPANPLYTEAPRPLIWSSLLTKHVRNGWEQAECTLTGAALHPASGYNVWGSPGGCSSANDTAMPRREHVNLTYNVHFLDRWTRDAFASRWPNETFLTFYYLDRATQLFTLEPVGSASWQRRAPSFCPTGANGAALDGYNCDIWHWWDGALSRKAAAGPYDAGAWRTKL